MFNVNRAIELEFQHFVANHPRLNPQNYMAYFRSSEEPTWYDHAKREFFDACATGNLSVVDRYLQEFGLDHEFYNGFFEFGETTPVANTPFIYAQSHTQAATYTAFSIACRNGHVAVVTRLLQSEHIDVNTQNAHGITGFYLACRFGRDEIVAKLIRQNKLDVTLTLNDGTSPLIAACYYGHTNTVEQLINDPRIDINARERYGRTAFHEAARNNHLVIVKLLLAAPNFVDPKNSDLNAFHLACKNNSVETVELLLQLKEINVNPKIRNDNPVYYFAIKNGYTDVLRLLLGCDRLNLLAPPVAGQERIHPFHLAIVMDKQNAVEAILTQLFINSPALMLVTGVQALMTQVTAGLFVVGGEFVEDLGQVFFRKDNGTFTVNFTEAVQNANNAAKSKLAAAFFALVLDHSDDFVTINALSENAQAIQFFNIARRLPIELQMILCNRLAGSSEDFIRKRDFEPALVAVFIKFFNENPHIDIAEFLSKQDATDPLAPQPSCLAGWTSKTKNGMSLINSASVTENLEEYAASHSDSTEAKMVSDLKKRTGILATF